MQNISEIAVFVLLGAAFAAGLVFFARWAVQNPLRVSAFALISVSFIYVGLAFGSDNPQSWTAIEMTGVALFGSLAGASLIGSPWFGVVGLALHPLWDIVYHYVGPGADFTPAPFALADAGFCGALAVYAALAIATTRPAAATPPPAAKNRRSKR
ncbi:MAG TPA: PTS sugar transporter subunit IIA [Methylocystis sp.]|nr:PTS sugar transporter subunit IIA [Methylocystis sp.]